jgi:hypothetical protein
MTARSKANLVPVGLVNARASLSTQKHQRTAIFVRFGSGVFAQLLWVSMNLLRLLDRRPKELIHL